MAIKSFKQGKVSGIQQLESKYNLRLPDDYLNFLRSYNGGVVEKDEKSAIYIEALNEHIYLDILYGVNTGYENANVETWMQMFGDEIPEKSLIIGDSLESAFIVLICLGENAGVYYWDHTYHFDRSTDASNTYFIANTFTDFIKGIL